MAEAGMAEAIKEKPLDLRVRKTRRALTHALYDLMCEKGLDSITVTELCERAEVRKATFYKHFADKNELLTYMVRELQRKSAEENTIGYDPAVPQSYYIGAFGFFMDFIEANEAFIASVLRSSASSVAETILSEQIMLDVRRHLKDEPLDELRNASDVFSVLYAGAVVALGKWWATQKSRPPKDEVVAQFSELISRY